jgi:hypothetical protein
MKSIYDFLINNWQTLTGSIVGVGGLLLSIYINRRDNAKLITRSTFFKHPANELGKGPIEVRGIKVRAVNLGRRPIILLRIQVENNDDTICPLWLNGIETNKGVKLDEQEFVEQSFATHGLDSGYLLGPDDRKQTINCWFEDTAGRKYYVKGFKKNLKLVFPKKKSISITVY